MSLINIPAFSGLNILAAPQRIRDDEAVVAVGCDFRSLDLRPYNGDRDNGQATAADLSNGASLFQIDETRWLGVLGEKSFARSPTFYADGTTGQRLFVADNNAPGASPSEWDWVRDVEVDQITNSTLSGTEPRLGVPKPAAINMANVEYAIRNGTITLMSRSSQANTTIKVDSTSAAALKPGDKINIDIPALGPGPFTISKKSADTDPVFTLGNSKLRQQSMTYTVKNGKRDVTFVRANHGFVGGEQVMLKSSSALLTFPNLPSGWATELYEVSMDGYDQVRLLALPSRTELKLTNDASADGAQQVYFVVVADADDTMESGWSDITAANWYSRTITYTPPDGSTATWEAAIDTLTERSYCVTFVNKFGDESEPSDPTKVIAVAQGDPVTFSVFPVIAATYPAYLVTGPGGSYQTGDAPILERFRQPTQIRLYRTDSTGTYRLVTTEANDERTILWSEIANNDGSPKTINWVDNYEDTELGEPLSTQGWQIPPKDLNGILITPGGSLIGFKGRSVYGSVPYAPYAFPISNRVAFDYPVKGLVATSAGIVVVTTGMPALIVGDDPATWSIQKLEYPYGCISRRSIVDMGEMAIYASADGLVGIAGANVEILTRDVMTRAQWNSLYVPATQADRDLQAAHAEGRYYGVTLVGGVRKAFLFDPRTRSFVNMTMSQSVYPVAMSTRLSDDTLMLLKSNGHVYEWNRGTTDDPYIWRSKAFQLTKPDILGCAQLIAPALVSNKTITMRLIAWDGETVYTLAVFSNKTGDDFNNLAAAEGTQWEGGTAKRYAFNKNINPFRLPVPNNRYTVYYVELEGDLPIAQVMLASVIDEIRQV